jgi:hypothetical protein
MRMCGFRGFYYATQWRPRPWKRSIDNVFFLEKSRRKMYTIFSAVQRQHRKSDVMTYFGLTACSAVYYHAGSSLTVNLNVKRPDPLPRSWIRCTNIWSFFCPVQSIQAVYIKAIARSVEFDSYHSSTGMSYIVSNQQNKIKHIFTFPIISFNSLHVCTFIVCIYMYLWFCMEVVYKLLRPWFLLDL